MSSSTNPTHFRPDLQGVRAVAVLCVVLFHAGVPIVPGGFIGVDVFFVLSGFFITGLLIRHVEKSGRVGFAWFYSRRFMRLVPASSLVLAVTLAATLMFVNPLDRAPTAWDGLFSAWDLSNFRFAFTATQYFVGDERANPFLHMWSLAVETQFYLLWPALIALTLVISRRSKTTLRRRLAVILVGLTVLSVVASILITPVNQPVAFFLLPTRAWELSLGGLLFLIPQRAIRIEWMRVALFYIGLAGIIAAAVLFTEDLPYPGSAALLPVLATAAVVLARPTGRQAVVIANPVGLALGRWSYSLYLWHWPILVFATIIVGRAISWRFGIALMVGATVLAWLTSRFVENPLRASDWSIRRKFALTGALTAAVSVIAGVAIAWPVYAGSQGAIPVLQPAELQQQLAQGALTIDVPRDLVPQLASVGDEATWPEIYRNGCRQMTEVVPMPPCEYGDTTSSHTMWLVGDSHAAHWFPALDQLAREHHWKLVVRTKQSCPVTTAMSMRAVKSRLPYTECAQWQEQILDEARRNPPEAIVTSSYDALIPPGPGLTERLAQYTALSRTVIFIGDTPPMDVRPPECIAEHPHDVPVCLTPFDYRTSPSREYDLKTRVTRAGANFVDGAQWLCTPSVCPVIVKNVLLWRDAHHITWAASLWLKPVLDEYLTETIPGW